MPKKTWTKQTGDNLKGQQFDLEQATTNATDRKSLKNVT